MSKRNKSVGTLFDFILFYFYFILFCYISFYFVVFFLLTVQQHSSSRIHSCVVDLLGSWEAGKKKNASTPYSASRHFYRGDGERRDHRGDGDSLSFTHQTMYCCLVIPCSTRKTTKRPHSLICLLLQQQGRHELQWTDFLLHYCSKLPRVLGIIQYSVLCTLSNVGPGETLRFWLNTCCSTTSVVQQEQAAAVADIMQQSVGGGGENHIPSSPKSPVVANQAHIYIPSIMCSSTRYRAWREIFLIIPYEYILSICNYEYVCYSGHRFTPSSGRVGHPAASHRRIRRGKTKNPAGASFFAHPLFRLLGCLP